MWVVVNGQYELHPEACAYLAGLRRADSSVNTERVYAGRVALYLSYCHHMGIAWAAPTLPQLGVFLHWLVRVPLPPRSRRVSVRPVYREKSTANAIMTTTCEFLRYSSRLGWVSQELVAQLEQPKFLNFLPTDFDPGEDGQFRTIREKTLKFKVAVPGYEWLSSEQVALIIELAVRARDRFLVALLAATGVRIGEALGLRREDMHFLPSSLELGCKVAGPHIHVRRRANSNGALAKSRMPRAIPVTNEVVGYYADYQMERDEVPEAAASAFVFVNLFHAPLGEAMKYSSTKDMFDRLAKKASLTARPHMLRHTAATRWLRAGVDEDVVQDLLGHQSSRSMEPYRHASEQDKRRAVEMVAARREGRS
jgi:integrase/recombinase XerD